MGAASKGEDPLDPRPLGPVAVNGLPLEVKIGGNIDDGGDLLLHHRQTAAGQDLWVQHGVIEFLHPFYPGKGPAGPVVNRLVVRVAGDPPVTKGDHHLGPHPFNDGDEVFHRSLWRYLFQAPIRIPQQIDAFKTQDPPGPAQFSFPQGTKGQRGEMGRTTAAGLSPSGTDMKDLYPLLYISGNGTGDTKGFIIRMGQYC